MAAAEHVLVDEEHVSTGQVAVIAAQTMQTEQAEASIYSFGVGCAVDRYGSLCLAGKMLAGVLFWLLPHSMQQVQQNCITYQGTVLVVGTDAANSITIMIAVHSFCKCLTLITSFSIALVQSSDTCFQCCRTELNAIVSANGCTDADCRYMALAVQPENVWQ